MSVVISGGGILGLILALKLFKLTQGNLSISMVEQYLPYNCDFSMFLKKPRVIALSRDTYIELMKIDINTGLSTYSTVINRVEISEYSRSNEVFITARDYKLSELGYVIELQKLRRKLFNCLIKKTDVCIYCPAKIQHIEHKQSYSVIHLNNGKYINSKLTIIANGTCVQSTNYYGLQCFRQNYYQTAIVAEVSTEVYHSGCAFERFTPLGPMVLLPMANNLIFLIWCVSHQQCQKVSQWSEERFIQELQNKFGWKLGKILNVGTKYFYDLWLIYSKNHISHRLALVGNAAQTLHPIGGQGFNLGVRDVTTLVEIIGQALCDNIDIGDFSVLNLYQKNRRFDQYKTILITDGLIRLFGNNYFPLVVARNLGLFFMEHCSFFKRFLINTVLSWKIE